MDKKILWINGVRRVIIADKNTPLMNVLREQLLLTDVKNGCDEGQCGACSVILNDKLTLSCLVKMEKVPDESTVLTVEGIGRPGKLHPIQQAFIFHGAAQCGICTPGDVVSSYALLLENPNPTRQQIRDWFTRHHNVCRCNGYIPYVNAVMDAAAVMRGEKSIKDITFTLPKNGKIWGSRIPRPTAEAKVTGTLDYGGDLGLKLPPDTLQLALVQAEVSHANIKKIDTSEAEKMPGVFKVVTHKET
jgi:aldehyde oxidoreductase